MCINNKIYNLAIAICGSAFANHLDSENQIKICSKITDINQLKNYVYLFCVFFLDYFSCSILTVNCKIPVTGSKVAFKLKLFLSLIDSLCRLSGKWNKKQILVNVARNATQGKLNKRRVVQQAAALVIENCCFHTCCQYD